MCVILICGVCMAESADVFSSRNITEELSEGLLLFLYNYLLSCSWCLM